MKNVNVVRVVLCIGVGTRGWGGHMGHVPQLTMRGTSHVFVPHHTHSCKYKEREAIWRYIMQENPSAAGVPLQTTLGELTVLLRPLAGGDGTGCPSPKTQPVPRLLSIPMKTLCNT